MAQSELRLDGLGIRKIVEIPPGIKVLSVSSNRLRHLGPIAECLTLQEVNLAANKLDEGALAPLAALPSLKALNVSRNNIRDLSPLILAPPTLASQGHAFPSLEELNISSNPIDDVTPAMSLQVLRVLTAASLSTTAVHCVHCSLEVIDLRSCCLQSISGLQALPYLSELVLDGNALLSCQEVLEHESLKALRLAHNAIGDISAVQLPSLTELDLASNNLQALNLSGAPRLVSLVLRGNQLTSLVQLSALRSLTFLDASDNQIRALEPSLRWSLRPLRVLLLTGNKIQEVEDIAKTMEMSGTLALEHLDLRDNPLSHSFYPFRDRLPSWTWEARASFAALAREGPVDAVGARDRYCSRLVSLCPSLQSLDGCLVDQKPKPNVNRSTSPRGEAYGEAHQAYARTEKDSVEVESRESRGVQALHCPGVTTTDSATSPVFREGSQELRTALVNLGVPPAQAQGDSKSVGRPQAEMEGAPGHLPKEANQAPCGLLPVVDLSACDRDLPGVDTYPKGLDSAQDGQCKEMSVEEFMQKGDEFEEQQLHIVEKLEKAHEELAKQWEELEKERQKCNEEQFRWEQEREEQRLRFQQFSEQAQSAAQSAQFAAETAAEKQADLHAGLNVRLNEQFESEVRRRQEILSEEAQRWEVEQQELLQRQKQQLEDQWQKEQDRRKKEWEKEQEEEFSKLQQRFQLLQRQFQEKLDSVVPYSQPRQSPLSDSQQRPISAALHSPWEPGGNEPAQDRSFAREQKNEVPRKVREEAEEAEEAEEVEGAEEGEEVQYEVQHALKAREAAEPVELRAQRAQRMAEPVLVAEPVMEPRASPTSPLTAALPSTRRVVNSKELPGSDGAFQRALRGRGIWGEDIRRDCEDGPSLKITASLDSQEPAPLNVWPSAAQVSARKDKQLKFLHQEIAAQRAFLRDIKNARKDHSHRGQLYKNVDPCEPRGPADAWHCVVSPVNAAVRGALEALISQQAWSMGRDVYVYSLGRAIQNCTLPARQYFDKMVARDAAREGVLSQRGFVQRAFFCDKSGKLSEVIASPLGFGAVYQGMALLVALELRHAERCWPETANLTGRTIVTEIALGRCRTRSMSDLGLDSRGLANALPLVAGLEAEYRHGADSIYLPDLGLVAILCPSRALPVFLAEYSRKLVASPAT